MSKCLGRRSGRGRRRSWFGFEAAEIVVWLRLGDLVSPQASAAEYSQQKWQDAANGQKADDGADENASIARFPPGVSGDRRRAAVGSDAGDEFADGVIGPRSRVLPPRDV